MLTTANQGIRGDTPLIVTYSEKRFFEWHEDDKSVNIRASGASYGGGSEVLVCTREQVVRRLTPTECARLQGFPDWWTADVPHADSAEYKMWRNGVSLPCVLYVMEGIAKALRGEK